MIELSSFLTESEKQMNKTVIDWKHIMNKIKTGKASNSILDSVMVNYYGESTPLIQIASVNIPEPNLILVKPYDRSQMSEFVHGINRAELGITPVSDAEIIRIVIPSLTEQVRKDSVKKMHKELETFKVRIRNERRDFLDKIRKESDTSEDLVKLSEKKIQELTNKYIKILDDLATEKEKEIMKI